MFLLVSCGFGFVICLPSLPSTSMFCKSISRMESEHNDTMENKTTEEPTIEGRL